MSVIGGAFTGGGDSTVLVATTMLEVLSVLLGCEIEPAKRFIYALEE